MNPQTNTKSKPSDNQYAEGYKLGQQLERDRVRAILSHPNAKHRDQLALTLACTTSLNPTQAGRVLGSTPANAYQ